MKYKSILLHRDAFEVNDDSGDVRKSVGIDKEGGLVFALDTMQVVVVFIGCSSYVESLRGKDIHETFSGVPSHQDSTKQLGREPAGSAQQVLDQSSQGRRYPDHAGEIVVVVAANEKNIAKGTTDPRVEFILPK